MRISLVGPTYPYRGGISHHTTLLAKTLSNSHDLQFISYKRQYPKIFFPGRSDKDKSSKGLCAKNVFFLIDSLNPITWVKTAIKIIKFKPDIVILPWWVCFWAPFYIILISLIRKFHSTQIIFLCHNVIEHESSSLKKTITTQTLSLADRIITQSNNETKIARSLLRPDIQIVQGFHPTYASLASRLVDQDQAKHELNLTGNVALFFGFIRPYKGLDVLLDAMPLVSGTHDITLLVVGEFWKDKDAYLEQIKKLGIYDQVRLVDKYVPNESLASFFGAADLVVLPYRAASGSGVSQLACGFGKPIVATKVGNFSEVVIDGYNGSLVSPDSPEELARAITYCLSDHVLEHITVNARKNRINFSWEKLVSIILNG